MKIKKYLDSLNFGEMSEYNNLAIAPVLGKDSGLEHLALCDALGQGFVISEKGFGSVPTLEAVNRTGNKVLAIAGEYVVGGRQNRTITRSAYFGHDFKGDIPVRCVQHGRWTYETSFVSGQNKEGTHFRHAGQTPIRACLSADSQGETWNAVSEILSCEGVKSSSADLHAVYQEKQKDFESYFEKFPIAPNQVGNLAFISRNGDSIFVLDLFDRPEIFSKYHKNLIQSYALESGLKEKSSAKTGKKGIKGFLDSLASCNFNEQKPVSMGKDYSLSGQGIQGNALFCEEGSLIYLNAFSKKQQKDSFEKQHAVIPEVISDLPRLSTYHRI